MWSNYGLGSGGWLLMSVAMVGFWVLVVFAITALFRGPHGASRDTPRPEGQTAQMVLRERFARGEISVDEYHVRQTLLVSDHHKE